MDITTASPAAAPRVDAATPQSATRSLSSDFETFLLMLTVQMKNQDPLNPIESSDFAVQLATFSGVEQQVRTNELLSALSASMAGSGISQLAGWIGTEVRTAGQASFDGAPLTLYPDARAGGADQAFLVVRDARGLPLARTAIQPGTESFTWAGVSPTGSPYSNGLYSFEIERVVGGNVVGTVPVEHYARVTEVRASPGGGLLVLAGGATVPASDILAVRPVDRG
jgi:flagellar basal-body rod modification protein FlgD